MSKIQRVLTFIVIVLVITACAESDPVQPSTSQTKLLHFYDYRWSLPENPEKGPSLILWDCPTLKVANLISL